MVEVGEIAPFFTEKKAGGESDEFVLERKLDFGPVVLAFFPAAFSSPCEEEMQDLKNLSKSLSRSQGHVVGVSTDSPFCLEKFKSEHDIGFDLVSDMSGRVTDSYGVSIDIPELGLYSVANRAVFILDTEGEVVFKWVADDPGHQPDIDRVRGEVKSLGR
ncbi:MAG: redoxin domain-containing protein [Candidatus Nanosalina sp.]